jgi:Ca2+/Na+ antiporter
MDQITLNSIGIVSMVAYGRLQRRKAYNLDNVMTILAIFMMILSYFLRVMKVEFELIIY